MFTDHQPLIAKHAKSAQGFADVVSFVIATQNQYFHRVGAMLDVFWKDGLDNVRYLTGSQKRGIVYAHTHAQRYVDMLANKLRCSSILDAYKLLLEIPHIGIVKAGFILQLTHGLAGCLDRHNLKVLGLDNKAFLRVPTSTAALSAKIDVYVATCYSQGNSEQLYDSWCQFIALKYPAHFADAEHVSRLHAVWCRAL